MKRRNFILTSFLGAVASVLGIEPDKILWRDARDQIIAELEESLAWARRKRYIHVDKAKDPDKGVVSLVDEDFKLVSFNFVENPDPAHSSKLRQRYAEKKLDESLYGTIVLRGKNGKA